MKNKKLIKNIIVLVLVLIIAGIVVYVGNALLRFAGDPARFRDWVAEKGPVGVLTIMGLAAVQAIAVLPAGPVQVAAGYAYGALWGTVFFIIGCTAGSMTAFFLVRRFGRSFVLLFFDEEKVSHIERIINRPKWKRVFILLFIIPGAPKDIVSYCAGMTDFKWWVWLLVCSFGRLPGTLLSTLGGSAILQSNYAVAAALFAVVAVTSVIGFVVYKKKMR